jgi:hypothetical protein
MSNFATVAELAAYLARDIDNADPSALLALSLASDAVRAYIGQDITSAVDDEVTLDGTGTTLLLLPQQPVTGVSSVVEDGVELTFDDEYYWAAWGGLTRVARPWVRTPRRIVVTYSHGYATVPGPVKAATLALAGRLVDSPAGVKQETIGAYSVTYSSGTPTLAENEARLLDQYRVR